MRPRICLAVAALPLLLAGVAGCGGGGGETTARPQPSAETTPALSKRELIAQGDGICAEVNAAVGTVSAGNASAAVQASQVAQLYSGMVSRLKALGEPQEAAGYTELISAAEALAQAESDARLAAERGESSEIEAAESRASSALSSFQSVAKSYGFKKCGEAPSAPASRSTAPSSGGESGTGGAEPSAPEAAPEPEATPETGGAGSVEAGGGGGSAGGGGSGGGSEGGGGSSGGIGPG
ncbi:MAG TPA: hypothetical protein VFP23_06550 [Solirubrobacterales bacterium]|nr:hypothetical protein [Solirubrobacterales bacterium]